MKSSFEMSSGKDRTARFPLIGIVSKRRALEEGGKGVSVRAFPLDLDESTFGLIITVELVLHHIVNRS